MGKKLTYFLFGITIGALVGGGIVWVKMNDVEEVGIVEIKQIQLKTKEIEKKAKDEIKEKVTEKKQNQTVQKTEKKPQKPEDKTVELTSDTVLIPNIVNDSVLVSRDSVIADTMPTDLANTMVPEEISQDTAETEISSEEEIIVKKEELIFSKVVDLIALMESDSAKAIDDSLISEVSGIKATQEVTQYIVEFWRSPINYRGYKMANKKILLYGIENFEDVILIRLKDGIYLRHGNDYYILGDTFAFKPLQKLTDEELLAKLRE